MEKNQPEEGLKGMSGNLESTIPIHEGADNKKTPNKIDEVVQGSVLKHERGKASQAEKSPEITLPILKYKLVSERVTGKRRGRDAMGDYDTTVRGS